MKRRGAPMAVLTWLLLVFVLMLLFTFLHECGHGLGALLDGTRLSTGFNTVGDYGKGPLDPTFRDGQFVTGRLSWSAVLGPAVNWALAVGFTAFLYAARPSGSPRRVVGLAAMTAAWGRLWQMMVFFVAAAFCRLHLEDEVQWALKGVSGLSLPIPFVSFQQWAGAHPAAILSQPAVYGWPALSLSVTAACFVLACGRVLKEMKVEGRARLERVLLPITPLLVSAPAYLLLGRLDMVIRINW